MRVKPGLPVAVSAAFVVTSLGVLLASLFSAGPAVAPCPAVEGVSPRPTASPGVCRGVTVTTVPRPTVVVTVPPASPQRPVVVTQPGATVTVVSVSPSPIPPSPTGTPSRTPSRTPTPRPTCFLPVPSPVCPAARHRK